MLPRENECLDDRSRRSYLQRYESLSQTNSARSLAGNPSRGAAWFHGHCERLVKQELYAHFNLIAMTRLFTQANSMFGTNSISG